MGAGRQQRDGYLDGSSSEYAHPLGPTRLWCPERPASGQSNVAATTAAVITQNGNSGYRFVLPFSPWAEGTSAHLPLLNIFEED